MDWIEEPGQDRPPCAGAGVVQLQLRSWKPVPQVLLQEPRTLPAGTTSMYCCDLKRSALPSNDVTQNDDNFIYIIVERNYR